MPFFPDPEVEAEEIDRPDPEWRAPRPGEIPVTIAVDLSFAQTEAAAVVIASIKAYSNGCLITTTNISIEPPDMYTPPPPTCRVGVRWPDATKVLAERYYGDDEIRPSGPLLTSHSGFGYDWVHHRTYWLWPLPPPGTLGLVFDWPKRHVPETTVEISTAPILNAARTVTPGWIND